MIQKIKEWGGVVALVAIILILVLGDRTGNVGNSGTRFPNGLSADTTSPIAGQVRGTTLTSTGLATLNSVVVGSAGTTLSQVNMAPCYIKAYAATIAASSTAVVTCQATALVDISGIAALTGVQRGDNLLFSLGTTTAGTTFMGVDAIGAVASTTNGYIEVTIRNLTGTVFTWPVGTAATGTGWFVSSR